MSDQLMALPLFQGIGKERIMELIEKVPFHFLKFEEGQTIFKAGEQTEFMRFVVSGQAQAETALCGGNVTLIQTITAPDVIAPDFLFGRITTYPFSLTAKTECGIMQLSKAYVVSIMQSDKICLLNMLNYLSRNAQKGDVSYKRMVSSDTSQRLAVMVFMLTGHRSQDIRIRYKQKDLCKLLGLRRSAMLELISELETRGVVLDNGTELQIPDRQQLVAELVKPGK